MKKTKIIRGMGLAFAIALLAGCSSRSISNVQGRYYGGGYQGELNELSVLGDVPQEIADVFATAERPAIIMGGAALAKGALRTLEESPYRSALEDLADFCVSRAY